MPARHSSFASLVAAFGLVLLAGAAGCSGEDDEAPPPPPPAPPSPDLLSSTTRISAPSSIASDGGRLLLGNAHALTALDKASAVPWSLVGGLADPTLDIELGCVERPNHVARDGDWLYFDSWGYRIQRLFLGADGTVPIEEQLPPLGIQVGCCQLPGAGGVAADDERFYWAIWDATDSHVYARVLGQDGAQLLASVWGTVALTAAGSQLYVATVGYAPPALWAIDLATGSFEAIQGDLTLPYGYALLPRAASASRFFWMDGTTLRAVTHGSRTPEVIATGLPAGIQQLATDGVSVYGLRVEVGSAQDEILRIDVASGSATKVVTGPDLRAVLPYQGTLWWLTPYTLEAASLDGTGATQVYSNDGSKIVFGGGLFGLRGRIVAAGESLLVHDVAAGTSTLMPPLVGSRLMTATADALYGASWNEGVVRIPVDAPVRTPENLATDLGTIEALFPHDGWLYWSVYDDFYGRFDISRMRTDGTGREVLFDGVHRQLALHDGRLFFLCREACSLPEWTIVSMALSGGPVTAEASAGVHPQLLVSRNGLLYLVDVEDPSRLGVSFGLWAIDVAGRRSARLVDDLPWARIMLDVSSRWLYAYPSGSAPGQTSSSYLNRWPIEAWDRLGAPQQVDPAQDFLNPVYAIHSDGEDLYFWVKNDGLKRLPE